MNQLSTPTQKVESDAGNAGELANTIERAIKHAAHLLPSQGPITAFVHHNTLHALEDLGFTAAVGKGAVIFGCQPYLTEQAFRELVVAGRIRSQDIEAVLVDKLGERAQQDLGPLGTRLDLHLAILSHELHDGPTIDVRWVVSETGALDHFRADAKTGVRERFLSNTKRWAMQDLRLGKLIEEDKHAANSVEENSGDERGAFASLQKRIEQLFELFDRKRIESWTNKQWESFSLHLLWEICEFLTARCELPDPQPTLVRARDWLVQLEAEDPDERVNETLIQFCSVFMDQGLSDWPFEATGGFYESFIRLYGQSGWLKSPWKQNLASELTRLREQAVSPSACIEESLAAFGIVESQVEAFVESSLLALRGFAGMIWQLESRGDRVTRGMPAGTLLEFLAIRLLLDRMAAEHSLAALDGYDGSLAEISQWAPQSLAAGRVDRRKLRQRSAFQIFELAQLLEWEPKELVRMSGDQWKMLQTELDEFTDFDRRTVYQLAFERKFRNEALDAISIHVDRVEQQQQRVAASETPKFQIVCCIDDREESFRRYLEELEPECETFGAAGFFAIPMYYRGAADAHYLPLCPAVVIPDHYVREEVAYSLQRSEAQRSKARRTIGTFARRVHVGSRTFTGGWIGTTILGSFATFPLVFRVLFPRLTSKVKELVGGFVRPPEVTRLKIERTDGVAPGAAPEQHGLTVTEMATAVERLLRDIGRTEALAPVFFVCGHGSSSLNNPHEAAYNCGACAGGRGGPNARAFAKMANDRRVRKLLAERGVVILDATWFVGCYHNTCDDNVTYFDLDDIPDTHRSRFEAAVEVIDEARKRDAHERCRRFVSAPLDLDFAAALKHVEGRSEDLSQARPEYNHATNALCFVGRRQWSRGLFLDRRAFLQSYDPAQDDEFSSILERILQAVIPVCAGISLEYYFSCVDPIGYGAGNKLPHNIVSLIGVMDGAASDLRPGLYRQMIEIHEPMRILFVIETTPAAMLKIIANNEAIRKLCEGDWVQLAVLIPGSSQIKLYQDQEFVDYQRQSDELAITPSSFEWYQGWRDHLKFASVGNAYGEPA